MSVLSDKIIELGEEGNYKKQGIDFLKGTGTDLSMVFSHKTTKFIEGLTNAVYKVTLVNTKHRYTFEFHQSAKGTEEKKKPIAYDILSCLTKYELGSFDDFCGDFGYETQIYDEDINRYIDNPDSLKIYKACLNEYKHVKMLWTDKQIEALQEIN